MIEVISPGLYSSIQDLGRIGYRKYGIPVSGAMDLYSAKLANQLLGNSENEAVLEITMLGPVLRFLTPCSILISGAYFESHLDNQVIENNKIHLVKPGQELKMGSAKCGMRAYLAVSGGLKCKNVLGSSSQYHNLTKKSRIIKGDQLYIKNPEKMIHLKNSTLKTPQYLFSKKNLDVYKGPEFEILTETVKDKLLNNAFKISSQSNRMGFRLLTDETLTAQEIMTSPVQPGTVQLTPSGQMIILGRDAQTTGGYARILQLTSMAQNVLAQKQPESTIMFNLSVH